MDFLEFCRGFEFNASIMAFDQTRNFVSWVNAAQLNVDDAFHRQPFLSFFLKLFWLLNYSLNNFRHFTTHSIS